MNIAVKITIPERYPDTIKEAERMVGKLGNPSKMPGYAWGISPKLCPRGAALRMVEGTVCHECYAHKGNYRFDSVKKAHETRHSAFTHRRRGEWVHAMALLISRQAKVPYFRIFDSGDLTGTDMLNAWMDVCERCPGVNFWMASREKGIIRAVLSARDMPNNLIIRVSADLVNGEPPKGFPHASKVCTISGDDEWRELTTMNGEHEEWRCPAPLQGNKCGDCRACWDKNVVTVTYRKH